MFVVERYLSATNVDGLAAVVERDRHAADRMTAVGVPVRHLSSIHVPSDETCFALFDAPSVAALRRAHQEAGITFERIVEAVQVVSAQGGRKR